MSRFIGVGCPLCGSDDFPHEHRLPTLFNSRYYCGDGQKHEWQPRPWRRPRCIRCGEVQPR